MDKPRRSGLLFLLYHGKQLNLHQVAECVVVYHRFLVPLILKQVSNISEIVPIGVPGPVRVNK